MARNDFYEKNTPGSVKQLEDAADIVSMMVGRDVFFAIDKCPRGERGVEIRRLSCVSETGLPLLTNINLNPYRSEILGIAGVEGNGQKELAEVLSGLDVVETAHAVCALV